MAYRFDGVDDTVDFSIGAFSGYTAGALTLAALVKRGATASTHIWLALTDSGLGNKIQTYIGGGDQLTLSLVGSSAWNGGATLTSTSLWYLIAVTRTAGGSTTPRFHSHDETSWTHGDGGGTQADISAFGGTDRIRVSGRTSAWFNGDIVCVGAKKASSSDGTIETLSRTSFASWASFGFDWLIGFDSSLVSGGLLQDQSTAGTGDETGRTGTSAVSDPPSWSWSTTPPATFVPQTIVIA